MAVNNQYKASVFSLLFSEPGILRELYAALEGVELPPGTPLKVNTLENALFMDRVNDISFIIAGLLVVLLEHQSTINPNMAVRLLIYAGRLYEKILEDRNLYSTQKLIIPHPRFFVLYNGSAPFPDRMSLRLSDSFANLSPLGLECLETKEKFALDLVVDVININEGRNEDVARKCRTLAEYSAFVARVRDFKEEGHELKAAIRKAVFYCRDRDILKEFLETHGSEVINMVFNEWSWDTAKEVWQEESREEGRKEAALKYEGLLRQEQERSRQEQERTRQKDEEIRRLREKLAGLGPDAP